MHLTGKVIWFYGLSGSGKTTLADMLLDHIAEEKILQCSEIRITDTTKGCLTKVEGFQRLDGDIVREGLTRDLGFSLEDRFEHIRRVCFVADLLSKHGVCVIASFITPLKAMRLYLRKILGNRLILIFADTPIEKCIERDVKGLYDKALKGIVKDMTGLTQDFEYPNTFGGYKYIRINTDNISKEQSLKDILSVLENV